MDDSALILLELSKSTICSLAIMVNSAQGQIAKALEELKEMLEDRTKRPPHLLEDNQVLEHIQLHTLLLQDAELIIGEIEQGINELEAEQRAEAQRPIWEKFKP